MGQRLSILLVSRETKRKIYNLTDSKQVFEILDKEATVIYKGLCIEPYNNMAINLGRLTRKKLSCECDVVLATTGWTGFDEFIRQVAKKAETQISLGKGISLPDYLWTSRLMEEEDEWRLSTGTDWVACFYNMLYLKKNIDWTKFKVLF